MNAQEKFQHQQPIVVAWLKTQILGQFVFALQAQHDPSVVATLYEHIQREKAPRTAA